MAIYRVPDWHWAKCRVCDGQGVVTVEVEREADSFQMCENCGEFGSYCPGPHATTITALEERTCSACEGHGRWECRCSLHAQHH